MPKLFIPPKKYGGINIIKKLNRGFTPLDLAGLEIWHKSNDVVLSGLNVTQWNDKSGNGRHAKVINSAVSPTYNASDPDFNNQPSLTFGASSNMRLEYGDIEINSTEWFFLYVIKPTTNTGTPSLFYSYEGLGQDVLVNYSHHNGSSLNDYTYFDGSQKHVGGTPNTDLKILEFALDSDANVGEVFVDGVSVGTNTYTRRDINNNVGLGGRPNAAGSGLAFVGRMAEFLLCSQIPSPSELEELRGAFNYS